MDKLGFGDLFDFSDNGEIEKARKAIASLETEYSTLSKHLTDDSAKISAALAQVSESLKANEKHLKALIITTDSEQQKALELASAVDAQLKSFRALEKAEKDAVTAKKAYEKTVGELKKELEGLSKELEVAKKAADPAKFKELQTQINGTSDEAKLLANAAGALNKALDETGKKAKLDAGSISALKKEVAEARKAFEDLGETADDASKQAALQKYVELKRALDAANKSTIEAVKENEALEGSLVEMRKALADMNKEYSAMSEAQRNSSEGQAFLKNLQTQKQAVTDVEESMGIYNRNVGNYASAFKDAANSAGLFAPQLEALERIQATFNALLAVTKTEQAAVNAQMAAGAPAAQVFAGGMKIVRMALIATGIGAFLVVVGSLIAYFTKTQEGANKLGIAMAYVGGFVDALIKSSAVLGRAIVEMVTHPIESIKSLGRIIVENIVNRFTSVGVILKAIRTGDIKGITDGFIQMGTGVANVSDKMKNFAKDTAEVARNAANVAAQMAEIQRQMQLLERDEINNLATSKEMMRQSEAFKNIRDNEFNSIAKRNAANESGLQVEQNRLKILEDLGIRRVNLLKAEIDAQGGVKKASNDQLRALREAENELADLREDATGRFNEFITARYTLEQERLEKLRAAEVDRLTAQEVALKLRLTNVAKNSAEELEIQKALIDKAADIEIASEKRTKNEVNLIRAQAVLDKKELDAAYFEFLKSELERQKQLEEEKRKKQVEQDLLQIEQGFAVKSQAQDKAYADELGTELAYLATRKINLEQFEQSRAELGEKYGRSALMLEIQALEARMNVANLTKDELQQIEKELVDKRKELYLRDVDNAVEAERKKLAKRQELIQAAQEIATEASNAAFEFLSYDLEREQAAVEKQYQNDVMLAGDNAEAKKRAEENYQKRKAELAQKAAKQEKAAALFSIAINTAAAVASVLSTGGGTRYADFGISAGILSAFVIAQGALQAALVLSKPIPQYFKGRKNGPAEMAIVDEKGAEIIERKGQLFMSEGTGPRLTYLGAGDKVYTAQESQQMLNDILAGDTSRKFIGSMQNSSNALNNSKAAANASFDAKIVKHMGRYFGKLETAIKQKQEFKLNITKEGIDLLVKKNETWNKYVNSKYDV